MRWAGNLSVSCFERGRGWWWQSFPSVTRNGGGRGGEGLWWAGNPSVTRNGSGRGGQEVSTPRHSKNEREGLRWAAPSRVSSEGGGGGGRVPLHHSKWEWEGCRCSKMKGRWARGLLLLENKGEVGGKPSNSHFELMVLVLSMKRSVGGEVGDK